MQDFQIDLSETFSSLSNYAAFALAVSGGGDSMALMHMIASWRDANEITSDIVILTVDHGLRADSEQESSFVNRAAAALDFEAHVLTLEGLGAGPSLQERARNERYQLMSAFLETRGINVLVTAHTLDDQAETFLMRLARGSGADGLAVMSERRALFGLEIVRPLLSLRRSELREWLASRDVKYFDDPANEDLDFERVRVRNLLNQLEADGLNISRGIGRSAKRLQRVRAGLDEMTTAFIETSCVVNPSGVIALQEEKFRELQAEFQLRVLQRIIKWAGGQSFVRYSKLEQAHTHILGLGAEKFAFGGAIIDGREPGRLLFYREASHHALEEIVVQPGGSAIWDGRIRVQLACSAERPVEIAALRREELEVIKAYYKHELSKPFPLVDEIALGLMTAKSNGSFVGVPQLASDDNKHVISALRHPVSRPVDLTFEFPACIN